MNRNLMMGALVLLLIFLLVASNVKPVKKESCCGKY